MKRAVAIVVGMAFMIVVLSMILLSMAQGSGATTDVLAPGPIEHAPWVSFIYPYEGVVNTTSDIDFCIYANDNGLDFDHHAWILKLEGASIDSGSNSGSYLNFTKTGLAEGNYTLEDTMYDLAGNVVSNSVHFKIDLQSPTVAITNPADGSFMKSVPYQFTWTGSDAISGIKNYSYSFDGGQWRDNGAFTYIYPPPSFSQGAHTFSVRAYDKGGLVNTFTSNFTYDSIAPTVSILNPLDHYIFVSSIASIKALADDAGGSGINTSLVYYKVYSPDAAEPSSWASLPYGTYPDYVLPVLLDGNWTLKFKVNDYAGNFRVVQVNFTIDTLPPTVGIVSPVDGSATNDDTPTVTWTGSDEGSGIYYYEVAWDGGAWLNKSTNLSMTLPQLSEGVHSVTVRAYDYCGKYSVRVSHFIVDLTAPLLDMTCPTNGTFWQSSTVIVEWNFATDSGSDVDHYEVRILNATLTGAWVPVSSLTRAASQTNVPEGVWTVEVKAVDKAGNYLVVSRHLYVDYNGPQLTITSPLTDSITNSTQISWIATDNGTWPTWFAYSLNGVNGPWEQIGNLSSFELGFLPQGSVTVTLRGNDRSSNFGYANITFVYDTLDPIVAIDQPSEGTYVNVSDVSLAWIASDLTSGIDHYLLSLYLEGELQVQQTLTSDQATVPDLSDGNWTMTVEAFDGAGNSATATASFVIDTVAPTIRIDSPAEGVLFNGVVDIQWTGADSLSLVNHYAVSVDGAAPSNVGSVSSWSFTPSEGEHNIIVTVFDHAGNAATALVNIIMDSTAPMVSISSPADGIRVNSSSVEVAWEGSDESSGIDHYEMQVDSGSWTAMGSATTHMLDLADGYYVITVRAYDQAGNHADAVVSVTVDTTEPEVVSQAPTGSDVAVDTNVVASFSEAMDQDATTVAVQGVAGVVTWSGNTVTFDPATKLTSGQSYAVTIDGKDLAGNTVHQEWTFTATASGTLSGHAVDENGNPVAGAKVILDDGAANTTTDATGYFEFEVSAGEHTISIVMDGYDAVTRTVTVDPASGSDDIQGSTVTLAKAKPPEMNMVIIIVAVAALAAIAVVYVVMSKRTTRKP